MSWYDHLRPESLFRSSAPPAFGLAAWLAHLPDRPRLMPNPDWFAQVAQSLRHDLEASWRTWHHIASFMKEHRTYFLHPALVRPEDFARARSTSVSQL